MVGSMEAVIGESFSLPGAVRESALSAALGR
jgi:hypothetical protein